MINQSAIPLVNWGMGIIFIGVFALVCLILFGIIFNMAKPKNNKVDKTEEE